MSSGVEEIEQGFIPTSETVTSIKKSPTRVLNIIQAYLLKDEGNLKREISFEPSDSETPQKATIKFLVARNEKISVSETNPDKVAALFAADQKDQGAFLQNSRIRWQKDRATGKSTYLLTIKGPKVAGAGSEYEFEIANHAGALALMADYGKDKLVYKTRTVQEGVEIAGKSRTLELDEFYGSNAGKIKLEIEHLSRADMIQEPDWRSFATNEVTNDGDWRNFNLAKPDPDALKTLKTEAIKLSRVTTAPRPESIDGPAA